MVIIIIIIIIAVLCWLLDIHLCVGEINLGSGVGSKVKMGLVLGVFWCLAGCGDGPVITFIIWLLWYNYTDCLLSTFTINTLCNISVGPNGRRLISSMDSLMKLHALKFNVLKLNLH